jgi:hypothetical protein
MTLKSDWVNGDLYTPAAVNAVAAQVNSNTAAIGSISGGSGGLTETALAALINDPASVTRGALDRHYPGGDVYNWKPSNTRRLQRSLGKALAGSGYCDHLIIGDSESAYHTGTVTFEKMWPRIMHTLLNTRGIPSGGTGWVLANEYGPTIDPRWAAVSGTWTNQELYLRGESSGAVATFTSDRKGTTASVAYMNTSGGFTVAIDGGSAVTVTPTGANTLAIYTVTGLSDATHTITITTTTSSPRILIVAARVDETAGFRIHNMAASQSLATGIWVASPTAGTRIGTTQTLVPDPDVVWISLGANDIGLFSVAISSVITALTTIRGYYPNADAVLIGEYEMGPAVSGGLWDDYILALYTLATTLDVPLIDLYRRSGGYAVSNGYGLIASDHIHPLPSCQADWGNLVAGLVLRAQ